MRSDVLPGLMKCTITWVSDALKMLYFREIMFSYICTSSGTLLIKKSECVHETPACES